MIPKKIHYCWFGGKPLPPKAVECINTWKKYLSEYEIVEWNETNFDIHCCKYVEEAYNAGKWAFVADYARFHALYNHGGVYFDTDIEVLKSFDDLLKYNAFFGFGRSSLTLPVFGAAKSQQCFRDILDYYSSMRFIKPDGSYNTTTIEITAQKVLEAKYGLKMNWEFQILKDNIAILPKECFSSTDWQTGIVTRNPNLYVIHYADGSWLSDEDKLALRIKRRCISLFGVKFGSLLGLAITLLKNEGIVRTFGHLANFTKRKCTPVLMYVYSKFFLKRKKIIFENFAGRGFGDNPKYIALELLKRNMDYDIVWVVNPGTNYKFPKGIRTVQEGSFREIIEHATAKFWVDNNRKMSTYYKSPRQKYIQTWHGFYPLKKMEKDAVESLTEGYIQVAIQDGKMTDLMVSGCKARTNIYKNSFWYDGEIAECGTPRNDIFFNGTDYRKLVTSFFKIEPTTKLVLYAPTFRDDHSVTAYDIDFSILLSSLESRFGGIWKCLVRLHPAVREKSSFIKYNDKLIDASAYDDIQELFAACDFLISDYSDCMFEFSLTRKPVILYASDLQEYTSGRSFYYDIRELPYQLVCNNSELKDAIVSFDENAYRSRVDNFFNKIGCYEKGEASKYVVDYIIANT